MTEAVRVTEGTTEPVLVPVKKVPKMGEWVHYHFRAGINAPLVPMPALITSIINTDEGRVSLVAFSPNQGCQHKPSVLFSEQPQSDRWTWPA